MLAEMRDSSLHLVDLHTSFDISQEVQDFLTEAFLKVQKGWPNRSLHLLGALESGGEVLFSHLQMSYTKSRDGGGHIHLYLTFNRGTNTGTVTSRKRKNLAEKADAIEKAMEAVASCSISCDTHCTIAWQLSGETFSPIVQLPLLRLNIPETPFGQVSGVRFTSLGEDSHEYVVLDITGEKDLHIASHFVLSGNLSSDILETAVERSSRLKDAFVKRTEVSEGGG